MIAYVKGKITVKTPTSIVVETNGIGYFINISLNTFSKIEQLEEVTMLTYLSIKEDSHSLFGFADEAERQMFQHLISVSGVGTNTARILLSSISAEDARAAIIGENETVLRGIKGIGPKSAKRLILELKDKLLKDGGAADSGLPIATNGVREEAISALVALGFNKNAVQKVLNKITKEQPDISDTGELIKLALNNLA